MDAAKFTFGQKIRRAILKLAGFLIIVVPLFFAVSALGTRFGIWDWRFGFGTLTRNIGPKLLFLLLGTGVLSWVLAFFVKPRKGVFISLLAIAIPLAGMGFAKSVSAKAGKLPLIHDISTDTQDVPQFTSEILAERMAMEGVNPLDYNAKTDPRSKKMIAVAQTEAYPDIRTLVREEDPEAIFVKALETARAMGWAIKSEDQSGGRIEATATTFWFGFKDDIVIRIQPGESGGAIVDVRSVSRVGLSDIGKNADRIRVFTARL